MSDHKIDVEDVEEENVYTNEGELSPALTEALVCLSEECAEVIQAISKILRFGARVNPHNGEHNLKSLARELADVMMMMGILNVAEILDTEAISEMALAKFEAVSSTNDGRFRHIFKYDKPDTDPESDSGAS